MISEISEGEALPGKGSQGPFPQERSQEVVLAKCSFGYRPKHMKPYEPADPHGEERFPGDW